MSPWSLRVKHMCSICTLSHLEGAGFKAYMDPEIPSFLLMISLYRSSKLTLVETPTKTLTDPVKDP